MNVFAGEPWEEDILEPLVKAQKYIIRIIVRKPYWLSSDELFREFNILDIRHQTT